MVIKTILRLPPALQRIAGIVGLALAYYTLAILSRHIASTPQAVTPVWPPDGLATGAVLLLGNWMGYGVFIGSFLANFWAFRDDTSLISSLIAIMPALGIALGTTLGTWFGAFLLRKTISVPCPLLRVSGVFKFLLLTAMVGPMVNATLGVGTLALNGTVAWSTYGTTWLTWWISNVSGILTVAPLLLSWCYWLRQPSPLPPIPSYSHGRSPTHGRPLVQTDFLTLWERGEPFILVAVMLLIGHIAFEQGYHLEYLLIPLLCWSAFRIEQRWVTLLTLLISAFAVVSTVKGQGSLVKVNLNDTLMNLQLFIGAVTVTILILSATIVERRQADAQMRLALAELASTNSNLELRVEQRTEELNAKNGTLQDTLAMLKKTQLHMVQSEKMSALGMMVAGVAHEINNPITFVHGNIAHVEQYSKDLLDLIQQYQRYYPEPPAAIQQQIHAIDLDFLESDLEKVLESMLMGSHRIRDIVLSLRNFSRLDETSHKVADIHTGIDNTVLILQHRLKDKHKTGGIDVITDYGQLPRVQCYPGQLNQVFMNLLSNAIDAVEAAIRQRGPDQPLAGQIVISTQVVEHNQVQIMIADNGLGMTAAVRSQIFNPFFTTKPVGQGTGLGLSISYQVITETHQGKLWCESTLGQGSQFIIQIPIS